MREIKFRAYDIRHEKMFEVESLHQDQVNYIDDGETEFTAFEPMYGYPYYLNWENILPLPELEEITLKYSKIVGNIYEHKHLLDNDK